MRMRSMLRSAARRLGYDIVSLTSGPAERRQRTLDRIQPSLIVDVGAFNGDYVDLMRSLGCMASAVSVEADPARAKALSRRAAGDPDWSIIAAAAGARAATLPLHRASNGQSSSLLELGPVHLAAAPEVQPAGSVDVRVDRLDVLLPEVGVEMDAFDCVWLKIDVQGHESAVLQGAQRLLRNTQILELEVSLRPLYVEQQSFHEMMAEVDDLGFDVIDINPVFESANNYELLQADLLMRRRAT